MILYRQIQTKGAYMIKKIKELFSNENGLFSMDIIDFLKANKYKEQIAKLEHENKKLLTEFSEIDKMTALELKQDILDKENRIKELKLKENILNEEISNKQERLKDLKLQLISTDEDIEMESFSLYKPRYSFATALGYKERLQEIRKQQRTMIKDKTAVSYFSDWTVEGSKAKGRKFTNDNIRQILRSFNNECEAAINKVRFSNIDSIRKRINRSFDQLNKLNETNKVRITKKFLNLKLDELDLAYEYEKKKEEEKEALREERERIREEKRLQKEISSKKKILDKDITHYQQMIEELQSKLSSLEDEVEMNDLHKEIASLQGNIELKESEKEELDYREAHATAGYVYVISNIGAFGEEIIKIGVTRRLNPYDRITELSSASVPFRFDIHAMIFSYEAYELETELHTKFNEKRVNRVNMRKEFFNISISEIKEILSEYKDLTIDFNEVPEAEEFRESKKMLIAQGINE